MTRTARSSRSSRAHESHYANFIKAVRSRKVADLNADILEGHLSSALCHTGNISYQLGKKSPQGMVQEEMKGDKAAQETFGRMVEHLAANGVISSRNRLRWVSR